MESPNDLQYYTSWNFNNSMQNVPLAGSGGSFRGVFNFLPIALSFLSLTHTALSFALLATIERLLPKNGLWCCCRLTRKMLQNFCLRFTEKFDFLHWARISCEMELRLLSALSLLVCLSTTLVDFLSSIMWGLLFLRSLIELICSL